MNSVPFLGPCFEMFCVIVGCDDFEGVEAFLVLEDFIEEGIWGLFFAPVEEDEDAGEVWAEDLLPSGDGLNVGLCDPVV